MSTSKKLLLAVLLVIVLLQFFPINTTNPPVLQSENFVDMYSTPQDIQEILKQSCYDCHSNETKYPFYAHISPVSYIIKDHIDEGREHLNFSEFGTYNNQQKEKVLQEASEEVEKKKMPMGSYLLAHKEAKLDDEQREKLVNYFNQIYDQINQNSTH